MRLRAKLRDCLYLNWALPAEALPPAPAPLRYERHAREGGEVVFASAVLFHHDALRLAAFPFARIGYPQLNLRFYVQDDQGVPSVLFRRMLMPGWIAAGARIATGQPVEGAQLDFPHPSLDPKTAEWRWRAELGRNGGELFEVEARRGGASGGEGGSGAADPGAGRWDPLVRYFVDRTRGYASFNGTLRRVDVSHPEPVIWPIQAKVTALGFLPACFGVPAELAWPALHSAWLAPEIPFVFDVRLLPRLALAPTLPQPAAGRMGLTRGSRASG